MYGRVLLKLSGEALMGDAPFGIDPGVNRIQTQQAPSEKPGGDEEHQRQSHLGHYERRT